MRSVAILGKRQAAEAAELAHRLVRFLRERGVEAWVEEELGRAAGVAERLPRPALLRRAQMVIVLGGDGTLLSAARAVGPQGVPILGVNLGGLGFLTAVSSEELFPVLEDVLRGACEVEERMTLQATLRRGSQEERFQVLNDVVITKGALARLVELEVAIDGEYLTTFRADGLILSTPTGSTAYCMAAGGPIVHPAMESIVLAAICPHTLTHRPLVLPPQVRLEVTLRGGGQDVFLTLDGQVGVPLRGEEVVEVRRGESKVRLLRPPLRGYFELLRTKLRWGERPGYRRTTDAG